MPAVAQEREREIFKIEMRNMIEASAACRMKEISIYFRFERENLEHFESW